MDCAGLNRAVLASKQLKIELSRPGGVRRARSSNPNLQSLLQQPPEPTIPHSASFSTDSTGTVQLQPPPPPPPSTRRNITPTAGGRVDLQALLSNLIVSNVRSNEHTTGQRPPPPPPPAPHLDHGLISPGMPVSESISTNTPSPQQPTPEKGPPGETHLVRKVMTDSASSVHGAYSTQLQQCARSTCQEGSDSTAARLPPLDKAYENMVNSVMQPHRLEIAAAPASVPVAGPAPASSATAVEGLQVDSVTAARLSTTLAAAAASAMAALSRDASVPPDQQESYLRQHLAELLNGVQSKQQAAMVDSRGLPVDASAGSPGGPRVHRLQGSAPGSPRVALTPLRRPEHASLGTPRCTTNSLPHSFAGSEAAFSISSSQPVRSALPLAFLECGFIACTSVACVGHLWLHLTGKQNCRLG
jgi:hypothetical protein